MEHLHISFTSKCSGCQTITRELVISDYFSACWPQVTRVSACVGDRLTPPTNITIAHTGLSEFNLLVAICFNSINCIALYTVKQSQTRWQHWIKQKTGSIVENQRLQTRRLEIKTDLVRKWKVGYINLLIQTIMTTLSKLQKCKKPAWIQLVYYY